MTINTISQHLCFGGTQGIYQHDAIETDCPMRFSVFVPPQAKQGKVPALFWLSGLTCTEENFTIKAGAQRIAAELGLIIIAPDTSPRGLDIPGESENFDFGLGAGFYVDARLTPWSKGYRMYSYITKELTSLIAAHFPVDVSRIGIFGHSMGGHGALTIALKNPGYFKSVSAFAPICSTIHSPWGEKALTGYLGTDQTIWHKYDTCALINEKGWKGPPILVDQGSADPFLDKQLKPMLLQEACLQAGVSLNLRMQEGYDHGYFFISTFIEDHLRFHARNL